MVDYDRVAKNPFAFVAKKQPLKEPILANLRERLLGLNKPGIIFIHIPKTGGSSLSAAIRKHYRLSKFNVKSGLTSLAAQKMFGIEDSHPGFQESLQDLRLSLIFHEAQKRTRFITGHFWANEHLASLKPLGYMLITCLRDPVDRWFSHFLYNRYKNGSHGRIEQNIDEFLQSREAESFGTTYVRYLGGIRDDQDYTSRSAVDRAICNLDMFDMVGFLHQIDDFRTHLKEATGFELRPEHRRKSPASKALRDKIKNSMEIRNAVEKICEPDLAVYEQALLQFSPGTKNK